MSYVRNIVEAFGGVRAMARTLGRPVSTVQGWKDRGSIPDGDKPVVLAAAITCGLRLTETDFFPKGPPFDTPRAPQEDAA